MLPVDARGALLHLVAGRVEHEDAAEVGGHVLAEGQGGRPRGWRRGGPRRPGRPTPGWRGRRPATPAHRPATRPSSTAATAARRALTRARGDRASRFARWLAPPGRPTRGRRRRPGRGRGGPRPATWPCPGSRRGSPWRPSRARARPRRGTAPRRGRAARRRAGGRSARATSKDPSSRATWTVAPEPSPSSSAGPASTSWVRATTNSAHRATLIVSVRGDRRTAAGASAGRAEDGRRQVRHRLGLADPDHPVEHVELLRPRPRSRGRSPGGRRRPRRSSSDVSPSSRAESASRIASHRMR